MTGNNPVHRQRICVHPNRFKEPTLSGKCESFSYNVIMKLHGIIPPVVTPFHADESLNLTRLRELIERQLQAGVHGIFVLGTTGEFFALSEAEKQAVMAEAVACVNGRVPVYAGTGAVSTGEVKRLTKVAEQEKITGVSIITPYFVKPNQTELYHHFKAIAESTTLQVILYNNPATCNGLAIEPETVAKLALVDNIVGIKDSSGDLQNTIELLRVTDAKRFSVLTGRDTLIQASLLAGAAGAIPASCNVAPAWCVGIYEAVKAGDVAKASELQKQLHPVRMALSLGTGNAAIKEAMRLLGVDAGPNRLPILPFTDSQIDKLRTAVAKVS
jgi:4-hydroxy-tetrahydrodipicolinate synthase